MISRYLADAEQTEALGALLATCVASVDAGASGQVIALEGDLGAGKTTLVRGFLRALGESGRVRSPTYTLVEPYRLANHHFYHLDLYRLGHPDELELLGLRDMLAADSWLLVEWPERGAGCLPDPFLTVHLEIDGTGRRASIEANGSPATRIAESLATADLAVANGSA